MSVLFVRYIGDVQFLFIKYIKIFQIMANSKIQQLLGDQSDYILNHE